MITGGDADTRYSPFVLALRCSANNRHSVLRLAAKGMVRKVITAPEVWWEAVDLWGNRAYFNRSFIV
jgi:hypothetical protein